MEEADMVQRGDAMTDFHRLSLEALDLLRMDGLLLDEAASLMPEDGSDWDRLRRGAADETERLRTSELRMALVGPMSSGKSTLINAIVGCRILPINAAAETMFPVEVTFDRDVETAVMTISDNARALFAHAADRLHKELMAPGARPLEGSLRARCQTILAQLNGGWTLPSLIQGEAEIAAALQRINELIYLSCHVDGSSGSLVSGDWPRVRVPYLGFLRELSAELPGTLVIVDTPGPDTAEIGEELRAKVLRELARSSLALMVLSISAVDNQATNAILQLLLGSERFKTRDKIYIAVNQIDKKGPHDWPDHKLMPFFAEWLGVPAEDVQHCLFQVSAKCADLSLALQHVLATHPQPASAFMEMVGEDASVAFGIDWERDLPKKSLEDLRQKAASLRDKSRLGGLLHRTLATLCSQVVPRAVESACELVRSHCDQIDRGLRDVSSSLDQERSIGSAQRDQVIRDIARLEQTGNDLRRSIGDKLTDALNDMEGRRKEWAQAWQETFEVDLTLDNNSALQKHITSSVEAQRSKKRLLFGEKRDAKDCRQAIVAYVNRLLSAMWTDWAKKYEREIRAHAESLHSSMARTLPAIEEVQKAARRLEHELLPAVPSADHAALGPHEIEIEISGNQQQTEKTRYEPYVDPLDQFEIIAIEIDQTSESRSVPRKSEGGSRARRLFAKRREIVYLGDVPYAVTKPPVPGIILIRAKESIQREPEATWRISVPQLCELVREKVLLNATRAEQVSRKHLPQVFAWLSSTLIEAFDERLAQQREKARGLEESLRKLEAKRAAYQARRAVLARRVEGLSLKTGDALEATKKNLGPGSAIYDVAFSFATKDSEIMRKVCDGLKRYGWHVFDGTLGKERAGNHLLVDLQHVYSHARFCVILASEHYRTRGFTRNESKFILDRQLTRRDGCNILIQIDDHLVEIEGFSKATYQLLLQDEESLPSVIDAIHRKCSGDT
jgi:GTPase SAR1 family protein